MGNQFLICILLLIGHAIILGLPGSIPAYVLPLGVVIFLVAADIFSCEICQAKRNWYLLAPIVCLYEIISEYLQRLIGHNPLKICQVAFLVERKLHWLAVLPQVALVAVIVCFPLFRRPSLETVDAL